MYTYKCFFFLFFQMGAALGVAPCVTAPAHVGARGLAAGKGNIAADTTQAIGLSEVPIDMDSLSDIPSDVTALRRGPVSLVNIQLAMLGLESESVRAASSTVPGQSEPGPVSDSQAELQQTLLRQLRSEGALGVPVDFRAAPVRLTVPGCGGAQGAPGFQGEIGLLSTWDRRSPTGVTGSPTGVTGSEEGLGDLRASPVMEEEGSPEWASGIFLQDGGSPGDIGWGAGVFAQGSAEIDAMLDEYAGEFADTQVQSMFKEF
ncbi:hypothetical protein T492DRAFT_40571 [Pavlovales sp. CCMP2436]|nr:hypothetical protein T492DRAFT_40571 [Pavlovales sp. CCMP2436]